VAALQAHHELQEELERQRNACATSQAQLAAAQHQLRRLEVGAAPSRCALLGAALLLSAEGAAALPVAAVSVFAVAQARALPASCCRCR
jgi:hypothetical protein